MDSGIAAVQTVGLSKHYGAVKALEHVDLSIDDGQYFVLLGPSGGGKTTLLRLLGGFVRASAGSVLLHGHDMTDVPPDRRSTSMVFQSYALFPHMNVAKNVGYGLRLLRMSASEVTRRVGAMLELVGLSGYEARMPHELSGGQQQRVQLARSLVLERDVLLLDEPLAALDAQLRKDMCFELKRIQQEVGITFVHVTHNQEEAMTVADRMAIISDGKLVEHGTPRALYDSPRTRFTAGFIGENNLLDGTLARVDGNIAYVDVGHATVCAPLGDAAAAPGQPVAVSIRSDRVTLSKSAPTSTQAQESLAATFIEDTYFGMTSASLVRLTDGTQVMIRRLTRGDEPPPTIHQPVHIGWRTEDARLHLE